MPRCRRSKDTADARQAIRALVISDAGPDFGGRTLGEVAAQRDVDVLITAGDLHRTDLAGADQLSIPAIGVDGNHCDRRYLSDLGMTDLHLAAVDIAGLMFTGLQGCVRYKRGSSAVHYSQSEYCSLVDQLPTADVIVSHCPPAGIKRSSRCSRARRHHRVAVLAGKYGATISHPRAHLPQSPSMVYRQTRVEYVYGSRILTI